MQSLLRISEAASLGLHAMVVLASDEEHHHTVKEISDLICASQAHMAKVLQTLTRAGLLESVRGPRGGFRLARAKDGITLLDVLEAIDGKFEPPDCLMTRSVCGQMGCMFDDLLHRVNGEVREYMESRNLDDVKWVFETMADRKKRE